MSFLPKSFYPVTGYDFVYKIEGHNNLGHLASLSIISSLYLYLVSKKRVYGALMLFFFPFLLFSYSRTSYLEVLFGITLVLLFMRKRLGDFSKLSRSFYVSLGLLVAACIFLFYLTSVWSTIYYQNYDYFSRIPSAIQPNFKSLDGGRLEYWTEALESIKRNPFFGVGAAGFFPASALFSMNGNPPITTSTNLFLDTLLDYGFIGALPLFMFSVIVFSSLNTIYRKRDKEADTKIQLFIIIVVMAFGFLIENIYLSPFYIILFITLLGIVVKPSPEYHLHKNIVVLFLSVLSFLSFQVFISGRFSKIRAYSLASQVYPFNSSALLQKIYAEALETGTVDDRDTHWLLFIEKGNPNTYYDLADMYRKLGGNHKTLYYLKKYFEMKKYIDYNEFEFLYIVSQEVEGKTNADKLAIQYFDRIKTIKDIDTSGLYANNNVLYMYSFCKEKQIICPDVIRNRFEK
jgi:hypothetical protein